MRTIFAFALAAASALGPGTAHAAEYRARVDGAGFFPGATVPVLVEVETQAGDNLIGFGLFSFAIDLHLGGTAGATGAAVSGVSINQVVFNDLASNRVGMPAADRFVGTAGVTTDVIAPNAGSSIGDVTRLFDFNLRIPADAQAGDTITLLPAQGALENLTVNDNFDPVSPQRFIMTTITVIPEPGIVALCALALGLRRRALQPRG